MRIVTPKTNKPKQPQLGDILKTKDHVYILVKFTSGDYAWFDLNGHCANGRYNSLDALTQASQPLINDIWRYTIYSSDEFDLKLVPKECK